MNVLHAINRKSRVDEARERVRASRDKLKEEARGAARKASIAAAGRASRDALNDAHAAARARSKDARKAGRKAYVGARVSAARRTASRPAGASKKTLGLAAALGAAGAYFLDPEAGSRRRLAARDRIVASVRRVSERLREQAGESGRSPQSAASKPVPASGNGGRALVTGANDQDLADRVKSEVFRAEDAPKGEVNLNVEAGVVVLRGETDPQSAARLVEEARKVEGVNGVQDLTRRPGTAASAS